MNEKPPSVPLSALVAQAEKNIEKIKEMPDGPFKEQALKSSIRLLGALTSKNNILYLLTDAIKENDDDRTEED